MKTKKRKCIKGKPKASKVKPNVFKMSDIDNLANAMKKRG